MTRITPSILIAAFLMVCGGVRADTVETTVKYISASAVYLDAGRVQGIQKGDGGEIRRGDSLIARVEIEFVADNSSSCRLLESVGVIKVGDRAIIYVATKAAPEAQSDTLSISPVAAPPTPAEEKKIRARKTRILGRAGVQVLSQNDLGRSGNDYVEPALVLRARVLNLWGSAYSVSLRLRSRMTDRSRGANQDWTNQLYELALYYDNPESRFNFGAGRLLNNRMSGIGYLDGLTMDYRLSGGWYVGAFGGTQPDLQDYRPTSDQTKLGALASYEHGDYASSFFRGTLALVENYSGSNPSREFAYEQVSYTVKQIFLYESGELDINRGWRRDVSGSSLSLSNLLLSARYSPVNWLAGTLTYDNRTNFRTYETRSVPDSLFDDALRQGWRLGANVKLPERVYLLVEAGLRTRQGEGTETRSGSAGAGSYNILKSGVQFDARVNMFRNQYSNGYQPSGTIARNLVRRIRVAVQYGFNQYTIDQTQTDVYNRWVRVNTDWSLSQHIYGSLYGEAYRGGGLDANRGFVEVGYRF